MQFIKIFGSVFKKNFKNKFQFSIPQLDAFVLRHAPHELVELSYFRESTYENFPVMRIPQQLLKFVFSIVRPCKSTLSCILTGNKQNNTYSGLDEKEN